MLGSLLLNRKANAVIATGLNLKNLTIPYRIKNMAQIGTLTGA